MLSTVTHSAKMAYCDNVISAAQYNVKATGHVAKLRRDLSV